MDPNVQRGRGNRNPGTDAYWQRRFFTLIGGLAVIGLLAWAVSGVASGGKSSNSGSSGPAAAGYTSSASTPSASVTSAPASPSPSPSASPSPSPSASPSASATKSASVQASGKASAKASPAQAASAPTACPAADLVLTLVASQSSYGPSVNPSFQLDIVSTSSATCLLDTGATGLKLVVSHGSAVAYNSTACVSGTKRHVVSLRRGVPVVTSMSWDKHETVNGCSATVMAATDRTYGAVAQAGGAQSPRVSFKLATAPGSSSTKKATAKSTSGA
ncbi:MAG TPA: hypothetical protein VGI00_04180 [Streptosporangiaceae bacterium]|jgi:hypothetical protein